MVDANDQEKDDQEAGNQFLMGEQMILFDKVVECKIREKASVGNTEEKKDFFQRQSRNTDPQSIARIEAPDAQIGEDGVPCQKKHSHGRDTRKYIFPLFGKIRFRIEAECKGDTKRKNVYPEIEVPGVQLCLVYALLGLRSFAPKVKLFRFIFFWRIQKSECLAPLLRMFAVMDIMRMDHPLQVSASLPWSPFQSLVNDDVVKNEVKDAIAKDAECHADHIRIIHYLCEVVKDPDRGKTEDQCEQIILFEGLVMYSMVRLMPAPEKSMHDVFMCKPGHKLPDQEGRDNDERAGNDQ